jgi:putative hydrolase of the HAD superfamily
MVEAVFFDLFETLVTLLDPDWQPGPSVAERLGIDSASFDAEWRDIRERRFVGAYADCRDAFRDICRRFERPADEAVIQRLYEDRVAMFAGAFAWVQDDLIAAIERIRQMGLRLGVVSNSAPEYLIAWERSRLFPLFHDAIFSHQVGLMKPQPEIYLLACQRLRVAPDRSLFIGDGDSDELVGAERVGMRPYWATWFLDRWPARNRPTQERLGASAYPRLRTFADLLAVAETIGRDRTRGREG